MQWLSSREVQAGKSLNPFDPSDPLVFIKYPKY